MKDNIILCKDCKKYRPFPDSVYGQCTRLLNNCYTIEKRTDYCSHAEQKYDDISDIVDNAQHTSSGLLEET